MLVVYFFDWCIVDFEGFDVVFGDEIFVFVECFCLMVFD